MPHRRVVFSKACSNVSNIVGYIKTLFVRKECLFVPGKVCSQECNQTGKDCLSRCNMKSWNNSGLLIPNPSPLSRFLQQK